jgi:hypothetical protein
LSDDKPPLIVECPEELRPLLSASEALSHRISALLAREGFTLRPETCVALMLLSAYVAVNAVKAAPLDKAAFLLLADMAYVLRHASEREDAERVKVVLKPEEPAEP